MDFGEAEIDLSGERTKVHFFVMTLPFSDVFFVCAFERECSETFQEGHKRAFAFFEGGAIRISYDNSRIAVITVGKGRERTLTDEFLRWHSHFHFKEHFCLVRRPNEKGHVEMLVGFARRNFMAPIPKVDSIEELNEHLETQCRADLVRTIRGKDKPKGELLEHERASMLAKLDLLIFDELGYVPATKIGAKVVRSGRYTTFQMAEVVVSKDVFAEILDRISRLRCCTA